MNRTKAKPRNPQNATQSRRQIELDGKLFDYTLRRSNRARYVRYIVSLEKGLTVVIPRNLTLSELNPLIQQKKNWILGKLAYFEELRAQQLLSLVGAGKPPEHLFLLGEKHRIELELEAEKPSIGLLHGSRLLLNLPQPDDLKETLERFLKQQAQEYLSQRLEQLAAKLEVRYNRVSVHSMKTRWGSCSAKKDLNFNWQLIFLPPEIIDYVIIHELCHLKELNHSPRFWQHVEFHCPDYKEKRAWLKQKASSMIL